ncbi:UNVERIFIED_CONTAM: putative polyol transporter 1 [Sesamum radiatum]|uniref:Polyol transporter 1 n=1 Tax=Sesamum radiatum TaxID=300843 RepID=A0AAW2JDR0_SESRA
MGIFSLYSLIGSAVAGPTSDWLGRRLTIVLAGVIFFFGALFMGLATNYAFLMVGRFRHRSWITHDRAGLHGRGGACFLSGTPPFFPGALH